MNPYLEALRSKLDDSSYSKLCAIENPAVHKFVAEASDLCHPDKIFICSDSKADISHVRKMAIETGEETPLSIEGHTVHFDGENDQGRDRANTKYLVPKGVELSKVLNQMDRQDGLIEVRGHAQEFDGRKDHDSQVHLARSDRQRFHNSWRAMH
jgi:phosphoenolpyruvate carboxykinase (GTP)